MRLNKWLAGAIALASAVGIALMSQDVGAVRFQCRIGRELSGAGRGMAYAGLCAIEHVPARTSGLYNSHKTNYH